MTIPLLPLPGDIQGRLDIILGRVFFRRAPKLREEIITLVGDACARRQNVAEPALRLADQHQPVILEGQSPGITFCIRHRQHLRWPCPEALIAADILTRLGHELPYVPPEPPEFEIAETGAPPFAPHEHFPEDPHA